MKIRNKITLWIAGTSLLAALSLATFIFQELIEEPLKIIDKELVHVGEAILDQGAHSDVIPWQLDTTILPHSPDGYWIKVYDAQGKTMYQSSLVQFAEIPENPKQHKHYNVDIDIPRTQIDVGQDDDGGVAFRVRILHHQMDNQLVTMRIAKPIEGLEEELIAVMHEAVMGVLICGCFIIIISYYLAGRILQPVVTMTHLARKISEDSLDQRIPLGKNRDEFAALAESLNRMFDGLQYSFERQRAFISNGSHELKSPLTRLLLTQEELLQNPTLPEALRDDLTHQLTTMRRMKNLVKNLLSLSRLEQQDILTLEEIDLGVLIRDVVENYREMLEATCIQLTISLADYMLIQGDQMKLFQLFVNLMDNGIRYNDPQHGRLVITGKQENKACVVYIDNAGQNIPVEEQELIFEQFYRVEKSRNSLHGGVGLGLTISQKIVELHSGRIEVRQSDLGGTKIRIQLPC